MATELQGSWFPSGYYGHFRSKTRADFTCEYRQLAKPQPPQKFYKRAKEPIQKHVFSHHDNRQAFLNDAVVFSHGLGRRRVANSTFKGRNDFMTWMPEREFVERSRPLASTYKVDFMKNSKQQLLTKRPKTSFDGPSTTSYRYAHGNACPNKEIIDANNYAALKLSLLNKQNRAKSAVYHRETVASCLSWVPERQRENVKPVVPDATTTTEFVPHPPNVPKQQSQQGPSSPPVIQGAWSAPAETSQQQQQQSPPTTTYDPPPQQQQQAQPSYEAPPPPPPQSEPMAQ